MTRKLISLYTILFFVFAASVSHADLRNLPSITVLAPSSVTEPLTEIIRLYSHNHNITITASYDESTEQINRIIEGNPADIVILPHPNWTKELKQMGVIDVNSISNLVKNRLALINTKGSYLTRHMPEKLSLAEQLVYLNKRTTMALSDPETTPLGIYSKDAIQNIGKYNSLNLWQHINKNILRTGNAKNNLYIIAKGNTAGITFYSDAYNNPEVNILSVFDEKYHQPITYQAAVVASENMGTAREFLTFLQSKEVSDIFIKYGFFTE